MEEVPGLPTTEPKAGDPTKEMEAALPTPLDIEVVMALVTAPLTLPMVMEVRPIDLPVLALPAQLAIVKVIVEEGPDTVDLLAIQAAVKVLPAVADLLMGEVVGEATGKAISSTWGDCNSCEGIIRSGTPGKYIPRGSRGSSSWLRGSLSLADPMPDPLFGRATDCTTHACR